MKSNETKKTLSKTEYKEALAQGIYQVCFEKKDGSFRVMTCTLAPELIPKTLKECADALMMKPKRKENDTVLAVYDLEKGCWRSFRIDFVATFNKIK
jgi:hypothetical protein